MTLREEIEDINLELMKLRETNRQLIDRAYNQNRDDSKSQENQQATIDKLQSQLHMMEITIQDNKKQIKGLEGKFADCKTKLRDAEDKNSRYENYYIPKLKDTRKFQKEVFDELEKIRQDAELLPSMFRAEAIFRQECKAEKEDAVGKMKGALK